MSVKYETMREIAYRKNMKMKLCAKWMTIVVENVALIILSVSGSFYSLNTQYSKQSEERLSV